MAARPVTSLALTASVLLLFAVGASTASAASSVVECGQLTGYTAPDPLAPADGSVQLGFSDTWTILPDATISPAAAAALPTIVNSGPTCLAMELDDDGNVTQVAFAASGTMSGTVDFDSGSGFYIFEDRLIVPTFITDANPGLAALFVTSYQAGTPLTVTFTVDTTTGGFTGFDGTAAFCGRGSVTSGGDGQVGDAIIPAAVLDAADLDALDGAGTRETCATVHAVGTIDSQSGTITITTDVDIVVAPLGVTITPPPTSTATADATSVTSDVPMVAWLVAVFSAAFVALGLVARRRHGAA